MFMRLSPVAHLAELDDLWEVVFEPISKRFAYNVSMLARFLSTISSGSAKSIVAGVGSGLECSLCKAISQAEGLQY